MLRQAVKTARAWQLITRRSQDQPCSARVASGAADWLDSLTNYERRGLPTQQDAQAGDAMDLGRMRQLAAALGNPQDALPVVHVAGTKGKGSTAAFLSSALVSGGYKVGTYSSPHILHAIERIAIDLAPIAEEELDALTEQHLAALQRVHRESGARLTWFEVMTGLAYKHFAAQQADCAVVEAGLGGELDATNVTQPDTVALSVITPIGLEHEDVLGKGAAAIARAKAGIMKPGRPVLIAPQTEPEAEQVLREAAERKGCPIVPLCVDLQPGAIELAPGLGAVQQANVSFPGEAFDLQLRMVGAHQCANAAVAASAAVWLSQHGFPGLTPEAIAIGLAATLLPARFQALQLSSTTPGEPPPTVILDGAHTPASAAALASTLRAVCADRPLALVIAMGRDKDHMGCMAAFREAAPAFVAFTSAMSFSERSASPGVLAAHWQAVRVGGKRAPRCREVIQASLKAAVDTACYELASKPGRPIICICGSLYLAGEALAKLQLEPCS